MTSFRNRARASALFASGFRRIVVSISSRSVDAPHQDGPDKSNTFIDGVVGGGGPGPRLRRRGSPSVLSTGRRASNKQPASPPSSVIDAVVQIGGSPLSLLQNRRSAIELYRPWAGAPLI